MFLGFVPRTREVKTVIIEKEKTGSTPYVLIDESRRYMRFEGESFHENVLGFYAEIYTWLSSFLKSDFDSFTFDCELKYFNSSTAKMLLNLLLDMDESHHAGNITVKMVGR
jgi:2-phospho-L-lactate guanylyltransferase (CobY/MobA/RfbA family)